MTFSITFLGATEQVTGSLYQINAGEHIVLLECGMIQGRSEDEARNHKPFPVDPAAIDDVVLSHAHIDPSGRIPLLVRQSFSGNIYTPHATVALCEAGRPGADVRRKWVVRSGEVPERPMGADCKSAGVCLRRFESFPLHHVFRGAAREELEERC